MVAHRCVIVLLRGCFWEDVFLSLDCSATHRAMGVHLTFVQSVDLDEWTQSQIDAMRHVHKNPHNHSHHPPNRISRNANA
mmetsp:Transcript_28101/g.34208  ORF Transcript_28101/g.34208 Transcript_28101/m.34208 type:complete len:80 (-) Transcript_28101:308-547(-)